MCYTGPSGILYFDNEWKCRNYLSILSRIATAKFRCLVMHASTVCTMCRILWHMCDSFLKMCQLSNFPTRQFPLNHHMCYGQCLVGIIMPRECHDSCPSGPVILMLKHFEWAKNSAVSMILRVKYVVSKFAKAFFSNLRDSLTKNLKLFYIKILTQLDPGWMG